MAVKLVQPHRVAELYGVRRMTVYRWANNQMFDVAPTTVRSPSGTRDRLLFDAEAIAVQYRREMLQGLEPGAVRDEREARLERFLRGIA